jgi:hypothetical protein
LSTIRIVTTTFRGSSVRYFTAPNRPFGLPWVAIPDLLAGMGFNDDAQFSITAALRSGVVREMTLAVNDDGDPVVIVPYEVARSFLNETDFLGVYLMGMHRAVSALTSGMSEEKKTEVVAAMLPAYFRDAGVTL